MRRFLTLLGVALASYAVWSAFAPNNAHAQVIGVQMVRPVTQVLVPPSYPPTTIITSSGRAYLVPNGIAPSYASTIRVYPQYPAVITYSAIPPLVAPAPGVYTWRTYYGYGIARPRAVYTESYYTPTLP